MTTLKLRIALTTLWSDAIKAQIKMRSLFMSMGSPHQQQATQNRSPPVLHRPLPSSHLKKKTRVVYFQGIIRTERSVAVIKCIYLF